MRLRPSVEKLLSREEDVPIRNAAVMALTTLAIDPSKLPKVEVDAQAWNVLRTTYEGDTSPTVRAEIMKTAALSDGGEKPRREILILGFSDAHPSVISQAVRGASRLKIVEMLPQTASLLTHPDRRVRLAAAIVMPSYGEAALNYIPALEAASAKETDDVVKKTMLGSLSALRGER